MRQVVGYLMLAPLLLIGCRETVAPQPIPEKLECGANERIIDGVCAFVCDRDTDCDPGKRCNLFTGVCVPDTREPEPENPPVPCTTGAKRCSADSKGVERCNENQVWTTIRSCGAEGYCLNAECLECEPGKSICKPNDDDTLIVCNQAGNDTFEFDCGAGATCRSGECGECTPNQTRCSPDGRSTQLCVRTTDQAFRYKWENRGDDSDGTCITDQCVVQNGTAQCTQPECFPGDQFCEGATAQRSCNDQGQFVHQNCSELPNFTANARCENDRCVDECGTAANLNSYFGCDYWTAIGDNSVNRYFKGMTASGQGTTTSDFAFVVSNQSLSPNTVKVTRFRNSVVETVAEVTVPGKNDPATRGVAVIKVPWQSIGAATLTTGTAASGLFRYAYRLVSTKPMTVYQFSPLEAEKVTKTCTGAEGLESSACNELYGYSSLIATTWGYCKTPAGTTGTRRCHYETYSNDASLLLPAHILGTSYVAIGQEHHADASSPSSTPSANWNPYISIVGTQDGTQVTVKTSAKTIAGTGVAAMNKGETKIFSLNTYSVLQIATADLGNSYVSCSTHPFPTRANYICRVDNDLTGTVITSNKPVAMLTGHACVLKPETEQACDHTEEMIFPFATWGKEFVAVQSHPIRNTSDSFCTPVQSAPDYFKIVSGCPESQCPDGTRITLSTAPAAADVLPPNRCETGTSLAANNCVLKGIKTMEFRVKASGTGANFRVAADQPINVMQMFTGITAHTCSFAQGDPSMILLPPTEQWRSSYTVLTSPGVRDNYLGISYDVTLVNEILVDGVALNIAFNSNVKTVAGTNYRVINVPVTVGTHSIDVLPKPALPVIPGAGVIVYGFDGSVSYGYTGGLDLKKLVTTIDPGG